MKERLLKYAQRAKWVAYPLFYFTCLMVFAALTFPYAKLKERVTASFNAQQRAEGGDQELQIDEMSGYWLSGARVKGVRLLTASSDPSQPPQKIEIDEATFRYGILSSLFGGNTVSFDALAFGGELSGSYETRGKDKSLDLSLDAIDISRIEPLVRVLGVPLQGKLRGSINLKMPEGRSSKSSGSVSLVADAVAVGDGKAKIKGALALPTIHVGTITLSGEAKDGVLKITKLIAGGKDLDLQGEGRITMRDVTTESLCDAQIRFRINDAYRAQSDVTKSLFGAPGSNAPALFELADPRIKQSKRADGFYGWTMHGPLARLDLTPAVGGGGGSLPGSP